MQKLQNHAEFRLYEPLILDDAPENEGKHFLEQINPNSLEVLEGFIEETTAKMQNHKINSN